ncbi:MAG: sugar phosphate isomerase/epimerase family protein [Planctomycetota bacterium]
MAGIFQLGISSTALKVDNLGEAFQHAVEIGAEGLELSYDTDKETKVLFQVRYPEQLSKLAQTSGVIISALGLSSLCYKPSLIGTPKQIEAAKKLIYQGIYVAGECGIKVLRIPFFGKNKIETEEELTRAANALLEVVESTETSEVIIGIESTMNFNQQRFLLDHLGNTGGVRIYQNTATALARKLDLPTGLRDLGSEGIAQIHFKDVRVEEGQPPNYDVALGEGDVDFRALAQALRAIGYEGWVILEAPPTDDPIAAGKKNLQFAREILEVSS